VQTQYSLGVEFAIECLEGKVNTVSRVTDLLKVSDRSGGSSA